MASFLPSRIIKLQKKLFFLQRPTRSLSGSSEAEPIDLDDRAAKKRQKTALDATQHLGFVEQNKQKDKNRYARLETRHGRKLKAKQEHSRKVNQPVDKSTMEVECVVDLTGEEVSENVESHQTSSYDIKSDSKQPDSESKELASSVDEQEIAELNDNGAGKRKADHVANYLQSAELSKSKQMLESIIDNHRQKKPITSLLNSAPADSK